MLCYARVGLAERARRATRALSNDARSAGPTRHAGRCKATKLCRTAAHAFAKCVQGSLQQAAEWAGRGDGWRHILHTKPGGVSQTLSNSNLKARWESARNEARARALRVAFCVVFPI